MNYMDEAPAKKITKSEKDLVLYGNSKINANNDIIKYLKRENEEISKLEDVLTNERSKSRNSIYDTSSSLNFQNRNINLNNSLKSIGSLNNGIAKVGGDLGNSLYLNSNPNILAHKSPAYSTYKVDINEWKDKEDQLVEILGYVLNISSSVPKGRV